MCVTRHSATQPRRLPPIRIDLVAGDLAPGQNKVRLWMQKDPANENRAVNPDGLWRRFYLRFAKH